MLIGIDARNLVSPLTGIGRFLAGAVREFERRGDKVHLFLPSTPQARFFDLTANLPLTISGAKSSYARSAWGQLTLPQLAREKGVDVLWGPAHRLPRSIDPGIARILTIHDLVWRRAPETMHKRTLWGERLFMRQAIASADEIVAVSDATRLDLMAEFSLAEDRVRRVYPGVGPLPEGDDDDVLRCHNIDRPYALFVGTLEPRKNLARLIAAYRALDPQHRAACMLVVAGGSGWGDVDLRAMTSGLERDLRFLGRVTDSELSGLLSQARFLAMPSLYEGLGLPILEANAFGVPALTSDTSSMPEVGGEAAVYVSPHDTGSITAGLRELIADTALRDRLSGKARENAARFRWHKFGDDMNLVFEKALAAMQRRA